MISLDCVAYSIGFIYPTRNHSCIKEKGLPYGFDDNITRANTILVSFMFKHTEQLFNIWQGEKEVRTMSAREAIVNVQTGSRNTNVIESWQIMLTNSFLPACMDVLDSDFKSMKD